MIRICGVTMSNFLSVGRQTQAVRLDTDALTLVLGANLDTGEANSRNGVGKTTLLHAISIGLFGEALTKIKVSNLVNNINGKAMSVSVEFERDGKLYRVERGRKPDFLRFYADGEESDSALGENKDTQDEITRLVGMSHSVFAHIVALNTTTIPFLRMRAGDQREIIEELFGITQIAHKGEALKKLLTETRGRLREEQTLVAAQRAGNTKIEQAVELAEAKQVRWEDARDGRVMSLAMRIEELDVIDVEAEERNLDSLDAWVEASRVADAKVDALDVETTSLRREAKRLDDEIARLERAAPASQDAAIGRLVAEALRWEQEAARGSADELARLERDRQGRLEIAEARRQAIVDIERDLSTVQDEIAVSDTHTCATCGQGLTGTDHIATITAKLEARKEACLAAYARAKAQMDAALLHSEVVVVEIEAVREKEAKVRADAQAKAADARNDAAKAREDHERQRRDQKVQADRLATSREDLMSQIRALDAQVEAIMADLRALGAKPVCAYPSREKLWLAVQERDKLMEEVVRETEQVNPHVDNIAALRGTLQEIDLALSETLAYDIRHQEALSGYLTKPDSFIRKKVVDRNLSHLNGRLTYYLGEMHLPHAVRFASDLEVEIALDGRDYDYDQLSRGEMNRVNLSTSWAFRDVWEALNQRMNLLFVDEVVDTGMDESGSEDAMTILTRMGVEQGRNVFLISHKDSMIGRADRILMVRKQDKFTTFEDSTELVE